MQRPEGKEKLVDIKEMGFSLGSEMRPEREVGPDHVGADRPRGICDSIPSIGKPLKGFMQWSDVGCMSLEDCSCCGVKYGIEKQ